MRLRLDILAPLAFAAVSLAAAGASRAGVMSVAVDHSSRLALSGPAGSVVVGNPGVADVTVVDSHTVFVTGKTAGSTDVTVLDPIGRTLFSGDVLVTASAGAHVVVHRGADARQELACNPTCVQTAGQQVSSRTMMSGLVSAAAAIAPHPVSEEAPIAAASRPL